MSSTPLHIGFDAKRIVRNGTGLGAYGRTLVNDLSQYPLQLSLYAPNKGRDDLRTQIVERDNVVFHYPQTPISHHLSSLFGAYWRTKGIVSDLKRDGIQLYHGLSGELPIGISQSGIPSVVTIHDLIFLRHPEFYNPIDVQLYTWKFRKTLREATHIIAISECTRRDIIEYGHVPSEKISLIYQSCAQRFGAETHDDVLQQVAQHYQLPQRYILNVGSIEQRKNVLQAVQALHYLPTDVSLVIIGRPTDYTTKVLAYVQKHKLQQRVLILHGVPDEHLPALYAMAEAFVYPSVYEGFGIPIIEAIRCGLPVVACSGSCLEEAGGPDNIYVAPGDVLGMANAIRRSLRGSDGREARIHRSQDYVQRFAGNDVAGQVYQLYHQILIRS
jgi:glycosyltransferase involved in cell wall biosynthesis